MVMSALYIYRLIITMINCAGRADKSERKDKLEWSLFKAFLNRFQEIFLYNMENRHHFYMHTIFFYLIEICRN